MRFAAAMLGLVGALIEPSAMGQDATRNALDTADARARAVMEQLVADSLDPRVDTLHVFNRVEAMPEPPDSFLEGCTQVTAGEGALEEACLQRTKVYVRFIVERDGSLTSPALVKGACPKLDRLALECVHRSARWKPGTQDGAPVRVQVVVPVQFEPR